MPNPTTPGVSVEEITKLPYSISLTDTALPTFIGYTEVIPDDYNGPFRINSLLGYEKYFGKAKKESIQLIDVEDHGLTIATPSVKFLMYYSLQMYFANGGGPCYIISTGNYTSAEVELSSLQEGLNTIDEIKEPTVIVFPDAVSLENENDFYTLYNQAIAKAENETANRFVVIDTYKGNSNIQSNNLKTIESFRAEIEKTSHAAAYFPHLKTILNYTFDETETIIKHTGLQQAEQDSSIFYADQIAALDELKILAADEISGGSANAIVLAELISQAISIAEEVNKTADLKTALTEAIQEAKIVVDAIQNGIIDDFAIANEEAPLFSGEFEALKDAILNTKDEKGNADGITLKNLESSNSLLYNEIKEAIKSLKVVLPPSSAMAGVYGRVDSVRGVWKAPANVSLNYVIAPTEKISEYEQSDLNIHHTGKSINAIRTFTGKGTFVWGARTLDGKDKKDDDTDNEWKYIHIRRYHDMIKQSISQALGKFIHEPNIPYTWLRAKTMIENFLNQQWMDGALTGSTTKEAYEVKVYGSKDPITENITDTMIVEIKIALVRPAEFIILNFSHKVQQS